MTSRNHPNDPPEHLDVAEMTNVFAPNVGGTCAATQVVVAIAHNRKLKRCIYLFESKVVLS